MCQYKKTNFKRCDCTQETGSRNKRKNEIKCKTCMEKKGSKKIYIREANLNGRKKS